MQTLQWRIAFLLGIFAMLLVLEGHYTYAELASSRDVFCDFTDITAAVQNKISRSPDIILFHPLSLQDSLHRYGTRF